MSIEFIKYGSTLENHDNAIQRKYVISAQSEMQAALTLYSLKDTQANLSLV